MDDAIYISRQVEMLLSENIQGVIPVKLFTDSEETFESITYTKQVEKKSMRMVTQDLIDEELSSYQGIKTDTMWKNKMKISNSQMNVKNKNQTREKFTKNAVVRGIKTETRLEKHYLTLGMFSVDVPWLRLEW